MQKRPNSGSVWESARSQTMKCKAKETLDMNLSTSQILRLAFCVGCVGCMWFSKFADSAVQTACLLCVQRYLLPVHQVLCSCNCLKNRTQHSDAYSHTQLQAACWGLLRQICHHRRAVTRHCLPVCTQQLTH